MEGILLLVAALFISAIVWIDSWAITNYERSESARSWCRAQFLAARDPRGAVRVSSYVLGVVAIVLAIGGIAVLAGVV